MSRCEWAPSCGATGGEPAGTALVLIPETVNFFNNIAGRRVAEALGNLGWDVRVTTLKDYDGEEAELVFLVSIFELFVACGDDDLARRQVERLRGACGLLILWLLEPAGISWFDNAFKLFRECGLDLLADNSFLDQSRALDAEQLAVYRHVFPGLTESEKRRARAAGRDDEGRTIPWTFLAMKTYPRCEFAARLLDEVDPGGFLYLSDVLPVTEDGPCIKDDAFQRILRKTKYQIWRAQHSLFYMEGERFRYSALAGCVPIKILVEESTDRDDYALADYVVREPDLAGWIGAMPFAERRDAFLAEICGLPSLEDELDRFVAAVRQQPALAAAGAVA